jgi:uncharacterized protein YodC (DUF2158 family)
MQLQSNTPRLLTAEEFERNACRSRFTIGTVVRVKGQKQPLTVDQWFDELVHVVWFDGATCRRDAFDPLSLELVSGGDQEQ